MKKPASVALVSVAASILAVACGPAATKSSTPAAAEPDPSRAMMGPDEPSGDAAADPDQPAAPAPPPPPADPATVQVTLVDGKLALPEPIVFLGPDQPAFESEPVLQGVATFLADRPDVTLLRIEVHTDSTGSGSANQAVSERRARAVAAWLVAHGVACGRLIPVGFGEDKPVADNRTLEGRAANRRVELIPAALRGRPIGGMPVDGGGKVAGDPCAP